MGIVLIAMTLIPTFLPTEQSHKPNVIFVRPARVSDKNYRTCPNPKWVTTIWSTDADTPFLPVKQELDKYTKIKEFDNSGKWEKLARDAYNSWRIDCQNPVKLFRATGVLGTARLHDPDFFRAKDFDKIWWDINIGWELIENPPKSYWFVRMGYRMSAGDGDRHIFGELPYALLKKNPMDKWVALSAVMEYGQERIPQGLQARKGVEFENLIFVTMLRCRKTSDWKPWDDDYLASLYQFKAMRLKSKADLDLAAKYCNLAIQNSPPEFDKAHLMKHKEQIKKFYKYVRQ